MNGISVPTRRRRSRASAALIVAMAVVSGACLHRPLGDARDGRLALGSTASLAQASPAQPQPQPQPQPAPAPRAAPSADAAASNDSSAPTASSGPVASGDDAGAPQEPSESRVRSTWIIPGDSIAPAPPPAPPATPPLLGDLESLPVAGHPPAWLSLPTGATGRRPVVIVIHGAGDRPERQCRGWRHATGGYPFVVCPEGRAWPRYTHIGGAPLLEYIDRALEAVADRYPDYADTSNPLLAGFSLGAAQATDIAVRAPARFPRVALVEGATKVWSGARASAFLQGGGQRVLFGCGQDGVRDSAERTAKRLGRFGLDAHVVFANVGHKFAPALQDAVRGELAWLMDGDDRWSSSP
ncbi:MAG TPA: hypothetical protein VE987_07220 [Polyangiaceae bacterium]|nr:hypothetical protein [Polyangiaceae bacterium]